MDRVSKLLAQFPGPIVLRSSRWKWLGFCAVAGLFTAGGAGDAISSGHAGISDWIGVGFFGVCTVAFAWMGLVVDFRMTLDGEGFGWRGGRLSERWRWADVGDFAVVEYAPRARGASLRKRVGFNDTRVAKSWSERMGERLSHAVTERECAIPDPNGSTTFGLPMADLASLMSQWQRRATASSGSRPSESQGLH